MGAEDGVWFALVTLAAVLFVLAEGLRRLGQLERQEREEGR